MTAAVIFISLAFLLILIIGHLLFTPMHVILRTKHDDYRLHWGRFFSGKFIPETRDFRKSKIRLKFFYWTREVQPFIRGRKKAMKPKRRKKKKSMLPFKLRRPVTTAKSLLRSFHVVSFRVNLDTDDYVLNAILFPVFSLLNTEKHHLDINFEGVVDIEINIKNKGWRLISVLLDRKNRILL